MLAGKTAVVTGSTRGLGLAIAAAFAAEGAAVFLSSRRPDDVAAAVGRLRTAGRQAAGLACDVADPAQVKALAAGAVDAFGGFDIWVNNAGAVAPYGPTAHVPAERFLQVVQTNILGTYFGSMAAVQQFLQGGRGKLINVLGAGARRPQPMQNAYGASKAWMRNFTLALAKEYADSGVGIFAFQPGLVDTDMVRQVDVVAGYEERLRVFPTVLSMWANPPELPARKALWLASAATDGRTGLEVRASGMGHWIAGTLAEGWRRLIRRPAPPITVSINTISPGL